MTVDGGHHIGHECDEAEILAGSLAGGEEQRAGVGAEAPVVVLARTVDAVERLFVEKHAEVMTLCNLAHDAHQQQVVVVGEVGLLEDGSQLELVGSHLVMAGVGGDAEAVTFNFEVEHESFDTRGDGAEIVVLKLLVLGAFVTHEGTAGHHQVGTGGIESFVDKEIFLFPAEIALHMLHILVEIACHACGCLVDRVEGTQQGSLEVERLSGVGYEDGGDTECLVEDEHRRGDVPGRVSAGFECVADAAVGEAGSVGFLLHEEFAVEFLYHAPFAVMFDKGVVLFGGATGEGVEPVGVVAGAIFDGPLLHSCGNAVGEFARDGLLVVDGVDEFVVGLTGEVLKHFLAVEHRFGVELLCTFLGEINRNGLAVGGFLYRLES